MLDLNALPLDALFTELTRDGSLTRLLILALDEDLGPGGAPGDITTLASLPDYARANASVVARSGGVIAGLRAIPELLKVFAPEVISSVQVADGQTVRVGDCLAELAGPTRQILAAERTLLNLVGRLSGVATHTRRFVDKIASTRARLLDTRKTTPGLRGLEKYAVRCGGGFCHRIGLHDAMLIKDNHLAGIPQGGLAEFVRRAVASARATGAGLRFVEVEVDSIGQFEVLLNGGVCGPESGGVDVVLLDNMDIAMLRQAVAMRDRHASGVLLEASGGVSLETIRAIAETGVDRISVGGLTHQAVSLDIALDVR